MAKKKSNLRHYGIIAAGVVILLAAIFFFLQQSTAERKPAKDLFISPNETLVTWYNEAETAVTLNEKGFVDGHVQRKVRLGDPSLAVTLLGAYTFDSERNAKTFYNALLQRDTRFTDATVMFDTSKVGEKCNGYQTKKALVEQLPPTNAIHLICQKEYAVIELLFLTYKQDGPSVMNHMAYLMMKRV